MIENGMVMPTDVNFDRKRQLKFLSRSPYSGRAFSRPLHIRFHQSIRYSA